MPNVILRHRKNGPIADSDWFSVDSYTKVDIDTIDDSSGNTADIILTAVPSPFARMHLFQTAFEMVESDGPNVATKICNHEGITSADGKRKAGKYHEMISHCLDLWEIIFLFNSYKQGVQNQGGILEFIPYNLLKRIEHLQTDDNPAHQRIAQTLETFVNADGQSANFDLLTNSTLYLIQLNDTVIGCTSPLTFFVTPEDIEDSLQAQRHLKLNRTDTSPFFRKILPLHKRDADFQIYIHRFISAYINSNAQLKNRVKSIFNYTQQSRNYLIANPANNKLLGEINTIYNQGYTISQFNTDYIDVSDNSNTLQILGLVIKQQKTTAFSSDFMLNASNPRNIPAQIPLVLMKGGDYPDLMYYKNIGFTANDMRNKLPYQDDMSLVNRVLPGIGIPYPCLYVNDFLEDKLIQMQYINDGICFFNGNTITTETESFLLPIKDIYFRYFTIEDIKNNISISRKISIIDGKSQPNVEVVLKIAIQKGYYVELKRSYVTNPSANNSENIGTIMPIRLNLAIFPFVRTNSDKYNDFYKVMVNTFSDNSLTFYSNYSKIEYNDNPQYLEAKVYKHNRIPMNKAIGCVDNWTIRKTCFDYVKVETNGARGIIIPLWIKKDIGSLDFSAAVDFGTTNTHIEIREELNLPTPLSFSNTNTDRIIGLLGEILAQDSYFIPSTISDEIGDRQYKFPTRTATNEVKPLQSGQQLELLSTINIFFPYDKKIVAEGANSELKTNHKWEIKENNDKSKQRVTAIIEELLYLIRTKIILGEGDPAKAKLVWFYPLSMPSFAKGLLERLWANNYNAIFSPLMNNHAIMLTESEAPYYYLKTRIPGLDSRSILSIDIGGGTADFVFFEKDEPLKATSVFFGANILFGTGFVPNPDDNNALVSNFQSRLRSRLEKLPDGPAKGELLKIFDQKVKYSSTDFINFLFTQDHIVKFTETLYEDSELKLLFLLYYGAIIYHATQIMLLKNIRCPQFICTSGNGSKILNILDASITRKRPDLSKFTKCLLKQRLPDYDRFEGIISESDKPKEATCKGGLLRIEKLTMKEPEPIIIAGDLNGTEDIITYTQLHTDEPFALKLKKSVVENVLEYIDKFIEINASHTMSYENAFNIKINDYQFIREKFKNKGLVYLNRGLEHFRADGGDALLKETLFFYPFIEGIYDLGLEILEKKH